MRKKRVTDIDHFSAIKVTKRKRSFKKKITLLLKIFQQHGISFLEILRESQGDSLEVSAAALHVFKFEHPTKRSSENQGTAFLIELSSCHQWDL